MDIETQAEEDDRKEFSVVRRIQTSKLAQMTKLYNELKKKMVSRENTEIDVKYYYFSICILHLSNTDRLQMSCMGTSEIATKKKLLRGNNS